MSKVMSRKKLRLKRALRLRRKVLGTSQKPRLVVFKSLKHISVQFIDDIQGVTLASCSTLSKEFKDKFKSQGANLKTAEDLGALAVQIIKDKKIKTLNFDRRGYKYHGVIKALADTIRKEGIKF
ncbi:50S ribosomal protein L18 [bacterium]|nr:50S ribosomal protein L18 [bacterium]